MNVLSLFDGISCGYEALKRLNIQVDNYFACEIDQQCIDVSWRNHDNVKQMGDVMSLRDNQYRLPRFDLLIGGSPCQSFSNAGHQDGFDDPRGKLFFEYVRVLKEFQPKYFLLENVYMKKEFRDVISSHLGVEPVTINSNLVSAQNRKRLYWANFPITQPEDKRIYLKDVLLDSDEVDYKYFLSNKAQASIRKRQDGMSVRTGKSPCLTLELSHLWGFNFTPKWTFEINEMRRCTPLEAERLQTLPDNYTAGHSDTARYKMLGNCWTVDVITHILKGFKNELCVRVS